MKNPTLTQFQDIIASIDAESSERYKHFEIYKCKVFFIDGSNLRIFEKYHQDRLVYYSYYWLNALNDLIIGWDSAPHHHTLLNFPHHKHIGSQENILPSKEQNLFDVLTIIRKSFA
jgi:hypothetical protein